MRRRYVAVVVALVVVASAVTLTTTASTARTAPPPAAHAAKSFVVGYTPFCNLCTAYQVVWKTQLEQAVKAAGGTLKVCLPGTSPTQQATCVEQFVTEKVNAIVFYAIDATSAVGPIKAANAAHIPVIGFVTLFPQGGEKVAFSVNIDDEGGGVLAGKALVAALTKKYGTPEGTVLDVQGSLGSSAEEFRDAGFRSVVAKYPKIKVVAKTANWDASQAATVVQDWFSAHPNTNAIYLQSDGTYLPGTEAALKRLGLWHPSGQPKHVILVSVDGSNLALNAVKCGYMEEAGDTGLAAFSPLAGKLTDALVLHGTRPKVGETFSAPGSLFKSVPTISQASVEGPVVQIPAVSVTRGNASNPSLFGNKYQSAPNGLSPCPS